jgi:hypothetical protein
MPHTHSVSCSTCCHPAYEGSAALCWLRRPAAAAAAGKLKEFKAYIASEGEQRQDIAQLRQEVEALATGCNTRCASRLPRNMVTITGSSLVSRQAQAGACCLALKHVCPAPGVVLLCCWRLGSVRAGFASVCGLL